MAVKRCCIKNCKSTSARKEDYGVTFHKFPKNTTSHQKWHSVIHFDHSIMELPHYVCSRHFCKGDFQKNKDSKYLLKSDAIPSIFPWTMDNVTPQTSQVHHDALSANVGEEEKNVSFESTGSEAENLEAIKKFIEEQEKEIQDCKDYEDKKITKLKENLDIKDNEVQNESFEVASKVMDMILTESELKINEQDAPEPPTPKQDLSPLMKCDRKITSPDKGNGSMSLYIGSKVEAKDFEEDWYAAEVVEVDYEDMEVLVRYEPKWKKHDEWINVSSPRLRPYSGNTVNPGTVRDTKANDDGEDSNIEKDAVVQETHKEEVVELKEESKPELKVEEKAKIVFEVGERCLARWRDNRRFVATVHKDMGDGKYEVIFDDGVHWTCNITRLHKMKAERSETLNIDTSFQTSMGSPSPLAPGISNPISPTPSAFHTHLFDPTRDYLCSKSERREKKRKLNIKEIFNIDQRKNKIPKKEKPKATAEKKPKAPKKDLVVRVPKLDVKKMPKANSVKREINVEVPDAIASIVVSIKKEEPQPEIKNEIGDDHLEPSQQANVADLLNDNIEKLAAEVGKINGEIQEFKDAIETMKPEGVVVDLNEKTLDDEDTEEPKSEGDPVLEEEVTLENFEKKDVQEHEEVIDKIKEAINKLEDGLNDIEKQGSPNVERSTTPKVEKDIPPVSNEEKMTLEDIQCLPDPVDITVIDTNLDNLDMDESPLDVSQESQSSAERISKSKKDPSRIKKSKKLRMLHEKKVKRDVERVKNELARMKRKFEEMRREMLEKQLELEKRRESAPLSGQWCCKWVNGQPVGKVSEIEAPLPVGGDNKPALPRRSVQVQDKRLPPGWTKHMVRRSAGHSAGKWHVVLVSPEECGSKKFYTKADMRVFLESFPDDTLKPYEYALMDFGVHLKLSRQMGWIVNTPDGAVEGPDTILPAGTSSVSPLIATRKKLGLKKRSLLMKEKRMMKRDKKRRPIKLKLQRGLHTYNSQVVGESSSEVQMEPVDNMLEQMPLEDGYVYVGSLKVQIIENLLRCPAEGCFKNFRTKTLLQMHIKHYHRELKTMMGATPKVLDLAYARTMPNEFDTPPEKKIIKVKIQKPVKRPEEPKPQITEPPEVPTDVALPPVTLPNELPKIPRSQNSPKLRQALINANKPVKRPKVLLPVRRPDPEPSDSNDDFESVEPVVEVPILDPGLDFETAISTHTVTKPDKKRKNDKKKSFASMSKNVSEDEEMFAMVSDDFDTRSSFPRSGTPDSKMDMKIAPLSSESNDDQRDNNMYMYTEAGERVKIVHMKREEIINCHCGVREEDGLMVQCELCLCWQHALCHNIQRECDVPEKYTCSICLNPRRGRRSRRFAHDQARLYEGALAGARPRDALRRSHELAGNLLRLQDALHALRCKRQVARMKSHPKLYLWATPWEQADNYSQDKLSSEYSDMHAMINGIGKENLPLRSDEDVDIGTPPSEEQEHVGMSRDSQLGSHALLSGLLSSDLLNTPEFDTLANSVQETSEWQRTPTSAPQPEAAIDNDVCRERLLQHIERCHALIDSRLESIEAQVAELESQDPSFGEHYETADFYPQTKQTIQMLMRDLDTMEELGVIT